MQADQQALQGLWKVTGEVSAGRPVTSGTAYYRFEGDRLKRIDPFYVEGGRWVSFRLEARGGRRILTSTYEDRQPDGTTRQSVRRELYELDGDVLRVCSADLSEGPPPEFSEQTYRVVTLERYHGPMPKLKQASGKQPVTHRLLGRLTYDDSFEWWSGEVRFKPGQVVELHIDPGERGDGAAVEHAADFVRWLKRNDAAARRCAAEWLLETYNAFWNQTGKDIAGRTFAARLRLDAISVRASGAVELYYAAGGLFRGHAVTVRVSEKRQFERAQLAG